MTYDVIQHDFKGGNIAGGEDSSFDQRVYVNPDGFIEIYELQFTSQGRPGLQIMQLSNIKTGVDLKESDFDFKPPQ